LVKDSSTIQLGFASGMPTSSGADLPPEVQ